MESNAKPIGTVNPDPLESVMLASYAHGITAGKLQSDILLLRIFNEVNGDLSANELLKRFLERNTK